MVNHPYNCLIEAEGGMISIINYENNYEKMHNVIEIIIHNTLLIYK